MQRLTANEILERPALLHGRVGPRHSRPGLDRGKVETAPKR